MIPDSARCGVVSVLILAALACPASAARAQDDAATRARPGTYFVGGSLLTWWNARAKQDPPGAGYISPYFHGSLEWPALGAMLNGGVFIAHGWGVSAEIAARRSQSAIISEDGRYKFEEWHLFPRYTDRERLISIVGRVNVKAGGSVSVQPLGGFTVSHATQSLTDRKGTYTYYGGTIPLQKPDRSADATRRGLVGGADVVFGRRNMAVTCSGRLHWIPRPEYTSSDRVAPSQGSLVIYVGAGVTWWPHRGRNTPPPPGRYGGSSRCRLYSCTTAGSRSHDR